MSCGCPIICLIMLADWLMDWFDVTLSPLWSDSSELPFYSLLFSFATSWSEKFGLSGTPGIFWQTPRDDLTNRSIGALCVTSGYFWAPYAENPALQQNHQSEQTLGAWFHPTSQSQLSEQFDRIHAIHTKHKYFMLLDSNQCHHLTREKGRKTEHKENRGRERDASG